MKEHFARVSHDLVGEHVNVGSTSRKQHRIYGIIRLPLRKNNGSRATAIPGIYKIK